MNERTAYINKIAPAAIAACSGTTLFASLLIAQAILEGNNGNSGLASQHNNHFGIKADKAWAGRKVLLPTREVINGKSVMITAAFRSYNSLEEGFKDRNKFLRDNPRYAKAGVFDAKTPEDQAKAFQKAGYATDPNYATLLISIINGSGKLKQFDS